MDLKEIKQVIELMKRNDLALFELEREGFKIKLQRSPALSGGYEVMSTGGLAAPAVVPPPPSAIPLATTPSAGPLTAAATTAATAPTAAAAATLPVENLREIVSPMVGTFYAAPSPEAGPFVKVGQEVSEDMVVCIIEAMKVMNEIKAETRGIVAEIVAENGRPVQFGQALFKVR